MAKGKQEAESGHKPLLNEAIRVPSVLLIDEEGKKRGIVLTGEALRIAQAAELDLVLVAPDRDPPVARIMDHSKELFRKHKQQRQSRHKSARPQLKEIRLRPRIDRHDRDIKVQRAIGFIEEGHRVQFTMQLRGREVLHADRAIEVLRAVAEELRDIARVDRLPWLDGKRISLVLAPSQPGGKKRRDSGKQFRQEGVKPPSPPPAAPGLPPPPPPEGGA